MKEIVKMIMFPFAVMVLLISIMVLPGDSAPVNGTPLGNSDLKIFYKTGKSLGLFLTQYKEFIDITENSGRWEDENKYQYTWDEGQAAFIKTTEMKTPQLVLLVLDENFKTFRGIKKGSTTEEIIKAYSDNYETIEAGDGVWFVYKWTAGSPVPYINGKTFSLSFYIVDDAVKSVMLKMESEETEEIPVG